MLPANLQGADVRHLVSAKTGVRIPVIASRGLVFSAWTPSPEDIKEMEAGKPLWLIQQATHIPEMTMVVGDRRMIIPPELSKAALAAEDIDPIIHEAKCERQALERKCAFFLKIAWAVFVFLVFGSIAWILYP